MIPNPYMHNDAGDFKRLPSRGAARHLSRRATCGPHRRADEHPGHAPHPPRSTRRVLPTTEPPPDGPCDTPPRFVPHDVPTRRVRSRSDKENGNRTDRGAEDVTSSLHARCPDGDPRSVNETLRDNRMRHVPRWRQGRTSPDRLPGGMLEPVPSRRPGTSPSASSGVVSASRTVEAMMRRVADCRGAT